MTAIKKFNGCVVRGAKLQVSMARYIKGGSLAHIHKPVGKKQSAAFKKITNPAFRDNRMYSEVLLGVGKQNPTSKKEEQCKVIPISCSLNVLVNRTTADLLDRAVIAENTMPLNLFRIQSEVPAMFDSVQGMYSLSPTKILIVFLCKENVNSAMSMNSPLWKLFDDVRPRSEGEQFDDRLVWIDCFGIHPVCWSLDNIRRIGEVWGPVLHIVNRVGCLDSLTFARMLVRTKAQNKLTIELNSCLIIVAAMYG